MSLARVSEDALKFDLLGNTVTDCLASPVSLQRTEQLHHSSLVR